jgi:hypothetical protein
MHMNKLPINNLHMNLRTLPVSALALLLAGCASVATTTNLKVQVASESSFAFTDKRPQDQRVSAQESNSIGLMIQLGDDKVVPSGPALVRTWLQRDLGTVLAGKSVVLTRFTLDVFDPGGRVDEKRFAETAARTPGANPASALVARALVGGIESFRVDRSVGIKIELEIDGKPLAARWGGSVRGSVSEEDISNVLRQGLDAMVREVRASQ